jgi:hypothetical protein
MAPKKETELVPSRFFGDPFALMRDMTSEFDRWFGEPTRPFSRWPSEASHLGGRLVPRD